MNPLVKMSRAGGSCQRKKASRCHQRKASHELCRGQTECMRFWSMYILYTTCLTLIIGCVMLSSPLLLPAEGRRLERVQHILELI